MSIRFASAASAVTLAACLAAPAFAAETDVATSDQAAEAEISVADTSLQALPVIAPIDLATVTSQDEETPTFTLSGSATIISDYRFRGVSQSDKGIAVESGITITHESGFYIATWGSNLAGWGTFGGSDVELDLVAGYAMPLGEGKLDVGLTWYMYPSGFDNTDFAELYAKVSGTIGPVGLTAGIAYAPKQEALGKVFLTGAAAVAGAPADIGDKEDNLYLSGDAVYGIADTPISLRAHIGYSDGNAGLGPNGTTLAPTGTYFDWLAAIDLTVLKNLTVSVAYVDTDISDAESAYLLPNFQKVGGGSIADATALFSVTAAF
ncbi:MAG: TorF family putative porin [Erythrobacter sp.]